MKKSLLVLLASLVSLSAFADSEKAVTGVEITSGQQARLHLGLSGEEMDIPAGQLTSDGKTFSIDGYELGKVSQYGTTVWRGTQLNNGVKLTLIQASHPESCKYDIENDKYLRTDLYTLRAEVNETHIQHRFFSENRFDSPNACQTL